MNHEDLRTTILLALDWEASERESLCIRDFFWFSA